MPASSTLQRVVGEQRALARQQLYVRLLAGLPSSMPADLDALVQVEETPYSPCTRSRRHQACPRHGRSCG